LVGHRKRLFGVRGRRDRYKRELAGQSLLELDSAALHPGDPDSGTSGRDVGTGTHRAGADRASSNA